MAKKRHIFKVDIVPAIVRIAKLFLKVQLLLILLILSALGFCVGKQAQPDSGTVPIEELFENLSVLSYRDAPSDSTSHFVVELSAHGHVFKQYDIDAHRFMDPVHGDSYRRSISGTRYRELRVRGHVDRGFWLELPDASIQALLPDQFDELYQTTLDFVKPLSTATVILGTLSGYSIGYRMATWSSSLSNPAVQTRVLSVPGIGRMIAREAWRRVLLEPVVMDAESDAGRFASVRGTQRIYSNFFKLAVNDSDRFIPQEAARLDSAGCGRESRAMRAFAEAVGRAAQDTTILASSDFEAIEDWASLLDRRGHWAYRSTPPPGEGRRQYFGTLAWYGLAPSPADERRIWVGPRVLVRDGDSEGFIADEIALSRVGCPDAWREWLSRDDSNQGADAWATRWIGNERQFAPIVEFGRGIARKLRKAS